MKNLYKIENELYIIGNNEAINENDHVITQDGRLVEASYLLSKDVEGGHKVILTTNKLLIKDGVQAIDDDFLEWFVKNPSCEEVEVQDISMQYHDEGYYEYKIIIPKEESKQNIIDNWLEKNGDPEIDKQVEQEAKDLCEQETLEEAKQEGYICPHTKLQCDDECCVSASDCHIKTTIGIISEPKQETLEEVAEKYAKDFGCKINYDIYYSFIAGVKWQQEQDKNKYSKEDMKIAFLTNSNHLGTFEEFIELFKNK